MKSVEYVLHLAFGCFLRWLLRFSVVFNVLLIHLLPNEHWLSLIERSLCLFHLTWRWRHTYELLLWFAGSSECSVLRSIVVLFRIIWAEWVRGPGPIVLFFHSVFVHFICLSLMLNLLFFNTTFSLWFIVLHIGVEFACRAELFWFPLTSGLTCSALANESAVVVIPSLRCTISPVTSSQWFFLLSNIWLESALSQLKLFFLHLTGLRVLNLSLLTQQSIDVQTFVEHLFSVVIMMVAPVWDPAVHLGRWIIS